MRAAAYVVACLGLSGCVSDAAESAPPDPIEGMVAAEDTDDAEPPAEPDAPESRTTLQTLEAIAVLPVSAVFTVGYYPISYGLGSVGSRGAEDPLWWLAAPVTVPVMMLYYAKEEDGHPVRAFGDIPSGLAYPWRVGTRCGSPEPPKSRPGPDGRRVVVPAPRP